MCVLYHPVAFVGWMCCHLRMTSRIQPSDVKKMIQVSNPWDINGTSWNACWP